MGNRFFLQWFGMPLAKLKEIRETNKNLTEEQLFQLNKIIEQKENEEAKKSK